NFESIGFLHTEHDKSIGLCKRTSYFENNTTNTVMQAGQFATKCFHAKSAKSPSDQRCQVGRNSAHGFFCHGPKILPTVFFCPNSAKAKKFLAEFGQKKTV